MFENITRFLVQFEGLSMDPMTCFNDPTGIPKAFLITFPANSLDIPGWIEFWQKRTRTHARTHTQAPLQPTRRASDVVCHTELQTDVINTKNATDVDLVFKRGDVEYMKFEGTLQAVELTKGAKSNTYDSIGNVDVSFRRNTIDFMYFRNDNVEVNTGISLRAESGKFDVLIVPLLLM